MAECRKRISLRNSASVIANDGDENNDNIGVVSYQKCGSIRPIHDCCANEERDDGHSSPKFARPLARHGRPVWTCDAIIKDHSHV